MNSIAWWPNVVVLVLASGIDLRTRRIPNWLSVPFLFSGMIVPAIAGGWAGLRTSSAGFGLAVLLFALPCFLRGMGLGDLKLAAGVGAWIGPGQFWLAFIVTAIVGGLLAVIYTLRHRLLSRGSDPVPLSIPYAPAIAIGTLFSFFA